MHHEPAVGHLSVVVLAAGQGKRMASALPKVLHCIGGKPLLDHVLDCSAALAANDVHVVWGHGGDRVRSAFTDRTDIEWVEQREQLGTGHALAQALPRVPRDRVVLVLYGDVPLVRPETLYPIITAAERDGLGLLTVNLDDPSGYGRIVRGPGGRVIRIVEQRDASTEELAIRECNTGIMAAKASHLSRWVERLRSDNAQGEFYLTDVLEMAVEENLPVEARPVDDVNEVAGVNDRAQLAALERALQQRRARALMVQGATLADPSRIDIRGAVNVGRDCFIDVNVVFEGSVALGERVRIGPGCVLRDAHIGDDSEVLAHCVIEGARVGARCQVGPFARLRPAAVLKDRAKAGNFVEIKKAVVGEGSKVNHLTYVGDASIGREVNVGAGTITCNYDGANKHLTVIGDRAFIGSNTALVAPVTVGAGATVGAGSTISHEAPAESLTVTRAKQRTIAHWQRPTKEPK